MYIIKRSLHFFTCKLRFIINMVLLSDLFEWYYRPKNVRPSRP